jgi:hypothetical protein
MKKLMLCTLALIAMNTTNAQNAKQVFDAKEIVWYGLDFTKTTFVGQFDQGFGAMPAKGFDIKNKWVGQWNALIAKEPQNFKIKEAFHMDNVFYDMSMVNTANSKMDDTKCMSFNPGKIERTAVDGMVKKYGAGEKKSGIGLVFIVENFNKGTEMADVYVTFFDIATKKILLCEKISGKAVGVGMRNYWAGSIKSILKQITTTEYQNWKSKN